MNEWQPIETAPKDNVSVLVAAPGWISAHEAVWVENAEEWWDLGGSPLNQPTHWQPLPDPPPP